MGFLDSVISLFTGEGTRDATGYWIYVRCHRCGEAIKTRIHLRNDLSPRDEGGYEVTKTLVGGQRCFERIEAKLIFDENRRLIERQISGGDFITAEDFEAAGNS
jgi:hypothetical protein